MDGREKILNRIKSDCDDSIRAIEAEAQKECDKIIAKAKADAQKSAAETDKKAQAKKAQLEASAKSRAELEARNAVLKQKRREIDLTVSALRDHMLGLGDNDYFELIYRLASKLSGMNGELRLNSRDLGRLPGDFTDRLRACGVEASISGEPADIDGGFILKHGDIEENLGFSALIAAKRGELEDFINRRLFA